MKKFLGEFKEFALKGNVMDLAVGVMIGAAFQKIVSSLVSDLLMPLIAWIFKIKDFTSLKVLLVAKDPIEESVYLNYGSFIQNIIDFVIVALCVFFIVKAINKLRKPAVKEEAPAEPSAETKALNEIIDILKKK